jgi:hypothetical protein
MRCHSVACGTASRMQSTIGYAKFYSRSHDAVIRVYDEGGNVIETHEHAGEFKEWQRDQNVCDYRVRRPSESKRCYETIILLPGFLRPARATASRLRDPPRL